MNDLKKKLLAGANLPDFRKFANINPPIPPQNGNGPSSPASRSPIIDDYSIFEESIMACGPVLPSVLKKKEKAVTFREDNLEKRRMYQPGEGSLFNGRVVQLSSCNFRQFLKGKDIAIVMFHDDYDEPTKQAVKKFNKLTVDKHAYAHVDCTEDLELCDKESVFNTPALKIYSRANEVAVIRHPGDVTNQKIRNVLDSISPTIQDLFERRYM